jgi:hypothetical protein
VRLVGTRTVPASTSPSHRLHDTLSHHGVNPIRSHEQVVSLRDATALVGPDGGGFSVVLRMRRDSHGTALEVDPRAALVEADVQEIRSAIPGAREKGYLCANPQLGSFFPTASSGN